MPINFSDELLRAAQTSLQSTEAARRRPPAPSRGLVCGWRRRRRQPYTIRLSATDISALASMKNVAKCDTWCELQNPASHRVFERKLRPRPPGRGHACLGVTPSDAPFPRATTGSWGAGRGHWAPAPPVRRPEERSAGGDGHGGWWTLMRSCRRDAGPQRRRAPAAPIVRGAPAPGRDAAPRIATPGQAGPPAELKHINKRRRRNLRGFP